MNLIRQYENRLRLWMVRSTLVYVGGRQDKAADLLGVDRATIRRTIREAQLEEPKDGEEDAWDSQKGYQCQEEPLSENSNRPVEAKESRGQKA